MTHEIWLRLLWAAAIIGAGVGLYALVNRLILSRDHSRSAGLESTRRGAPVLLYFTTPTCAPCKTVQRPAIQRLSETLGDRLQVVEIDATVQPEVANQWGVLSVPTTFVIDARGQARFVNHGVASAEKLLKQIKEL
jgi:thioredoxin-like negative regulator of GroEL